MAISIEDIREASIDLLSRLGMTLPCTVELVYADGFLMAQPTSETPGAFMDEEGVLLSNAIDEQPLVEYLLSYTDRIQEQRAYLMADAAEGGFRVRLGCDDESEGKAVIWQVKDV